MTLEFGPLGWDTSVGCDYSFDNDFHVDKVADSFGIAVIAATDFEMEIVRT